MLNEGTGFVVASLLLKVNLSLDQKVKEGARWWRDNLITNLLLLFTLVTGVLTFNHDFRLRC